MAGQARGTPPATPPSNWARLRRGGGAARADRESGGALRWVLQSQAKSGARGRADLVGTTMAYSLRAKPTLDWWVQARVRVSAGDELCNEPDRGAEAKDGAAEGGNGGGWEEADCGAVEGADEADSYIAGGDGNNGERAGEWRKRNGGWANWDDEVSSGDSGGVCWLSEMQNCS